MITLTVFAFLMLVLLAFAAEYVDSSLGMGYGTSLTPILIALGWEPLQIVPVVLFTELLTGLSAAITHHIAGNVDLLPRKPLKGVLAPEEQGKKMTEALRVGLVIGSCSLVGTLIAVLVAIKLPGSWLKIYIGVLVTAMGLLILFTRKRQMAFSWKRIVGLSVLASFNKGMSGGGYGPGGSSGQILSGVKAKNAIAITSLAEALTCLVGFVAYFMAKGWPGFQLLLPLTIGSLLSVPLSGVTVKRMKENNLRHVIGWVTLVLGLYTLYNIFFK